MYRIKISAAVGLSVVLSASAPGQILSENLKLLPNDGAASDHFGWSVAIGESVVAVGAYGDDDNGAASGSAYLFDAHTGVQIAKLLPGDGESDDWFGLCIAVDDGVVVVGAFFNDDNGLDSGAAYMFDASSGMQIAKLLPEDGSAGALFGCSVDIDGGVVAIGATYDDDNGIQSGSVYLFDVSSGKQMAKLLPVDGDVGDQFGSAVAVADGVVAAGAAGDDDNGASSGSAYLFNATTGTQLAKIVPDDGEAGGQFGISIDIRDGVVAVGAWLEGSDGSAYLFDVSTQSTIAKLLPSSGCSSNFGRSIAILNGVVAVGDPFGDASETNSGSGFVFDTNPCSSADLAFPPGDLDFSDVSAFLIAFGKVAPEADLATPMGQWDFSDVVAFLTVFAAGCP